MPSWSERQLKLTKQRLIVMETSHSMWAESLRTGSEQPISESKTLESDKSPRVDKKMVLCQRERTQYKYIKLKTLLNHYPLVRILSSCHCTSLHQPSRFFSLMGLVLWTSPANHLEMRRMQDKLWQLELIQSKSGTCPKSPSVTTCKKLMIRQLLSSYTKSKAFWTTPNFYSCDLLRYSSLPTISFTLFKI